MKFNRYPYALLKCINSILAQILLLLLLPSSQLLAQEFTSFKSYPVSDEQMDRIDDENDKTYELAFTYPDSALNIFRRIFRESQQLDYAFGMANAMILSANVYINVKREEPVDPALPCLRIAEKYLQRAKKRNRSVVETWCNNMGAVYSKKNQMDSAMIYLSKSLELYLQLGYKKDGKLVMKYLNLETIFYVQKQYDKVIEYAKTAEKIALGLHLKEELYKTYATLACVYTEVNKPDSSLYYLAEMDKIPYKPDEAFTKLSLEVKGTALLKKNLPAEAVPYFLKALNVNKYPSPNSWQGLGNAYKSLKQYKPAESYLLKATGFEASVPRTDFSVTVYNDLADLYDSANQYKNAYAYRSKAALLQKQLDDSSKIETINKLEVRYLNAQKDKQLADERIAYLAIQNKLKNKNLWMTGIVCCALLLVMIILALYQKKKLWQHKSETLEQQQEIEKLKASITTEENERSRIGRQLHDDIMVQFALVKMNLEALPAQIPELEQIDDFVSVKEMMDDAGRDLRLTAHNLAPDTLLADGLTQALLYFCKNIQYRTKLKVTFQHYGETPGLPQETAINIYRITQELIQNIIKHAAASNVLVQLNYRPHVLTLTIEDDGRGFNASDASNEGMGLKSIRSRLKVMNGEMEIHDRHPKGTSISIQVNL